MTRLTRTLGLAIAIFGAGCGGNTPPDTVPESRPEYEPLRTALKTYHETTLPYRKEAAAKAQAVPNQATSPANAEDAVRTRERTLAEAIRTRVRPAARAGDLFPPPIATLIRNDIRAAFESPKAELIRDELQEQNEGQKPEAPPAVVNDSVTAPRLPPLLVGVLPPLPESLEFDFQNRTLILRDVDANIVVDLVSDALPERAPSGEPAVTDATRTAPPGTSVLPVPNIGGATVFAVIGDSGTGDDPQHDVAQAMVRYFTESRRFSFVLMLGDNLYDDDYVGEFSEPYKGLLDRGVTFYATLGNHDRTLQRTYQPFNMGGRSYYAFTKGNARFVSLDSNDPTDAQQHTWLDTAFGDTGSKWRIAFFHHPLYSSGQHASQSRDVIRPALEQALLRNHVDVVFSGHEHLYERIAPQQGIRYFVSGGGGRQLYDVRPSPFDQVAASVHHFMVIAIAGDRFFFEAITPDARLVDCGVLWLTPDAEAKGGDATTNAWIAACRAATAATSRPSGQQ